jgi:hypothetical protein
VENDEKERETSDALEVVASSILNMGQANAWRAALYGVVCERTLRQKYSPRIGELLGVTGENAIQRSIRDNFYK